MVLAVKNPTANVADIRDPSSIPGSERSPGGGHGDPLQCSCLENPVDRGAWRAAGHGVTESAQARTLQQQPSRLFPCLLSPVCRSASSSAAPPGGFLTRLPVSTQRWLSWWAPEPQSWVQLPICRLLAVCPGAWFLVCGMRWRQRLARGLTTLGRSNEAGPARSKPQQR